jgi:gamma-glutamyltranspeptidase/glutathione hydrolase
MKTPLQENWTVTKAAKMSREGIVVAQNAAAAEAGAEILRQGGNAVDAAVATAFALGTVEPWMSGIGGIGLLIFGDAATKRVQVVDFGPVAPSAVDPARYRPVGGTVGASMFGWPRVEADRNMKGYESMCLPGSVEGLGFALETFGRKSLAEVMAPAIELAERGMPLDWHTSLAIAVGASELAEFASSRAVYLPNALPPVSPADGALQRLKLGNLAATYRRLAEAGRRDFYEGELAEAILADLESGGSIISAADLRNFRARLVDPLTLDYRGVTLHAATALSGAPTYLEAMGALDKALPALPRALPDAETFVAYAEALTQAFRRRLGELGAGAPASNTTHLSVVDRDGNMVALTNTLLARFGSKVVLPKTGILMNNGMMWFDPVPGRPNSVVPGGRPLANMCPVLMTRDGVPWAALGACGGRRIIPAVTQLTSFLVDFSMPLEKAFATPRIDATGEKVVCDNRFPPEVVAALAAKFPLEIVEDAVYPTRFAVPSAVTRRAGAALNSGMAYIHSPAAAAVVAE